MYPDIWFIQTHHYLPQGTGPVGFIGGSTTTDEDEGGRLMYFVKRGQFEFGSFNHEEFLIIPRRYAVVVVVSPKILC